MQLSIPIFLDVCGLELGLVHAEKVLWHRFASPAELRIFLKSWSQEIWLFHHVLASLYINLTQARVIWEEEASIEKIIPISSDCIGKQAFRTFFKLVIVVGRPVHCGWCYPWLGAVRSRLRKPWKANLGAAPL